MTNACAVTSVKPIFRGNSSTEVGPIDRARFLTKILATVNVVAGVRTVTNRG